MVDYSNSNNPIVVVEEGRKAEEIEVFEEPIIKAIFPSLNHHDIRSSHADIVRYRVKLNGVITHDEAGDLNEPDLAWVSLRLSNSRFKDTILACPPTWLGAEDKIKYMSRASILVSLKSQKDAEDLLSAGTVVIYNTPVTATKFEERPTIRYCGGCGSISHSVNHCPRPRCMICTNPEHTMDEHPCETPPKCINCHREHEARFLECDKRRLKLGLTPLKQGGKPKNARKSNEKHEWNVAGTSTKQRDTPDTVETGHFKLTFINSTPGSMANPRNESNDEVMDLVSS
jgi:hypothetical protein